MRNKPLNLFSLIMVTIVSVDSIRNLPVTALFGAKLIFFFLLATIGFLLPSAFVSAELSSGWPKQGGIYVWVKTAFGPRWGLLAIWLQWVENLIWYPTILSFVCGTLGYLMNPALATHKQYLFVAILTLFWLMTVLNLFGMQLSVWMSNLCSLLGLVVPMSFIILLGVIWTLKGHRLYVDFSVHNLLPNFHQKSMFAALTGVVMSLCGIEIATVHARDVHNPQINFPKALLYSAAIIVFSLIFGSLAIAIVLPANKISLVTGIMQAFDVFLSAYHMHWMLPIMMLMLVIGGMGSVNNWIISPVKGLLVATEDLALWAWVRRENRYKAPTGILLIQAAIVSMLTSIFLLVPTANTSYWVLTVLAAELYMLMYVLMFVAALWLRYSQPSVSRAFRVPGGKWGIGGWSIIGVLTCLFTMFVGLISPEDMSIRVPEHYSIWIVIGTVLLAMPPFLIYARFGKREI